MSVRVLEVMSYSAGGIGRHVASLVSALDGGELDIDVAAPPDGAIPMPKPVLALEIPARPGLRFAGAVKRLRELSEGYDVVHAHGLRAGIAALRARAKEQRVIVSVHNLVHRATSGRLGALVGRRAEARLVADADLVWVVSAEMRRVLGERAPDHAGKIELLRIGLPEPHVTRTRSDVRAELGVDENTALVVTVARLAPQKALHVLLDAIARLDSVRLAIVGDGPLASDLTRRAEELGVTGRVHFLGWRDAVGDHLAAADLFALSSTWEARPLAIQEAIMAGVPCVSTDVGGVSELIVDGVSGRLVPAGDAGALADAIADVLGAADRGASLAARAKKDLMSVYSNEAMLARVRAEYVGAARA